MDHFQPMDGWYVAGGLPAFDPGISADFEPLPDITAYELAVLLPFMHGRLLTREAYDAMGSEKRHLKARNG